MKSACAGDMLKITDTMMCELSDRRAKYLKKQLPEGSLSRRGAAIGHTLSMKSIHLPETVGRWNPSWSHLCKQECGQKPLPHRLVKKSDFWEPDTYSNPTGRALENLNFSCRNICKGKDFGIRLRKIILVYRSNTRVSVLQELWSFLPHHCCWIASILETCNH